MIAYLVHCSLIWLIALLVYELWLRRTTFHRANRWYLNAGILLGLLLPLYRPGAPHPDALPLLEPPMHQLAIREQRLEVISRQAGEHFNLPAVLLLVWLAGTALFLFRLLREGLTLLRWRRRAIRTTLCGSPVFVTGAPHGPFSAFGAIYLSDADGYAEDELRFILAHELAHLRLLHSVDKCFALLLRCLLWWHPLVHVYYERLSLVQEFQADQPLRQQAPAYGRFLIDESLAVSGAGITHPFFHSPLKTRIRMLQRFATRSWQKSGYITALVLLAGGSFLWSNKSIAYKKERQGNVVVFNGNRFEMGVPPMRFADGKKEAFPSEGLQVRIIEPAAISTVQPKMIRSNTLDTATAISVSPKPDNGDIVTVVRREVPVKMNGTRIYEADEVDQQVSPPEGTGNLVKLLIEDHLPSLAKLPDGVYNIRLSDIIADASGKIVYYESGGVSWHVDDALQGLTFRELGAAVRKAEKEHAPDPVLNKTIGAELEAGLQSIRVKPGVKDGKPVIAQARINDKNAYYVARVQGGRVTALSLAR